jgi:O-antigen/teichoic acid export membrane protein
MLKVLGRSDLFLKLEILKKFLAIPTIIIGIYWGVEALILGMIVNSQIAYFLNSYWSGKFIDYPTKEQISDILPSFLLALSMSIAVFLIGQILQLEPIMKLVIQIMSGAIIVFLAGELFKLKDYLFIKSIVIEQAINFRNDKIIKS